MSDHDGTPSTRLRVDGVLPGGLSGRYVGIGPDPARSAADPGAETGTWVEVVSLQSGEARSRRGRRLGTEPSGPGAGQALLEFGGRLLVLRDGAIAEELGPDLRSVGRVDLAGRGQAVSTRPTLDPFTGELHLLASPGGPWATHQVISSGAMTRRSRPLGDAPAPVHHLAVTRDRLVLFAAGATGIAGRRTSDPDPVRWFRTPTVAGREVVAAHDDGGSVVVLVAGRSLERWTLDPAGGPVRRHLVDAAPLRRGCIDPALTTAPFRHLYGVGGGAEASDPGTQVVGHDLRTGRRTARDLGPHRCIRAVTFVGDPQRTSADGGGWLLAVVDDLAEHRASLVVLDAADLDRPIVATIHLPGPLRGPSGGLWSAS